MEPTNTAQKQKLNWLGLLFLTITPVLAAILLPLYVIHYGFNWFDLVLFSTMAIACGMSITAGYHRYFSHKSYECRGIVKLFYLLFGAATFQNSVLVWASDHREHHRHVDREGDPYNIGKGFFWAHIGWMFYSPFNKDDFSNVKDLLKDKMIFLQHRYYLIISPLMGFGFPLLIGAFYGRPMAGLLWGGLARVVFGHHTTFLINSAAHMFGSRPYSKETSARDFWLLAFFTYGEGFHNFHHAFAADYRNGVRWFQWDPSKWTIWILSKIGLASRLQRVPKHLYLRPHLSDAN